MKLAFLDFESYWDSECTLSKLSPLEYVRHPEFELISLSAAVDKAPPVCVFGIDDVRALLRDINVRGSMAVGHNMSGFDSYLLTYVLGVRPAMWGCTMAMARPIHAKDVGLSLAALVHHYGVGVKDGRILTTTRGKHLEDFTPDEIAAMRVYNNGDTEQCRELFHIFRKHFSLRELWQIDAVIRMRTQPKFELDMPLLETALTIERDHKLKSLLEVGKMLNVDAEAYDTDESIAEAVRSTLASTPRMVSLLTKLDVEVPMKPSITDEDKMIPALAKSDPAFMDLLEHPDERVATVARVRLQVKSTLLETRIEKLLTAARLIDGMLPVPLKYCGADTTGRDSGEEYNCQNLPRVDPTNPKLTDALRNSLRAPAGHRVIVADQSQIELRVNHFLWRVPYSMAAYNEDRKADLYKAYAVRRYRIEPEAVTKPQRQYAKVAQLGCGFGVGGKKFQLVARNMGGLKLTPSEAVTEVNEWRASHPEIVEGWAECDKALHYIKAKQRCTIDSWGMVSTTPEGLLLPSGRLIRYPDLRRVVDPNSGEMQWVYGNGRHRARIYGPKVDENIVQALARDTVFECAFDFYRDTGLYPSLRLHDELVYVVPESEADALLAHLQSIMRTPPKWWPELVVHSEGDSAQTYGAAK